jgi:hypothetical protein
MSHQLGCRLSHKVAAIAPIAGTIQTQTVINCLSTASPPVFYMHGTLDSQVPYTGVEQTLDFWIDRNNANASVDSVALPDVDTTDGSTIMKYSYKNSEGIARVVFYKVLNGGHNWSGTAYGYSGPGYKNMDVNTSQEIWNFVKDFVLEPTDISEEQIIIPGKFTLDQNYPNPFNPSTTISWQSPGRSWQTLKVYDVLGNEIAVLINGEQEAGNHSINFNAANLSSGVYFYRLDTEKFSETKSMILIK